MEELPYVAPSIDWCDVVHSSKVPGYQLPWSLLFECPMWYP